MTFYLTFDQRNRALSYGWVEIVADTHAEARKLAFRAFGEQWSDLYTEDDFRRDKQMFAMFPDGKIGRTIK